MGFKLALTSPGAGTGEIMADRLDKAAAKGG